ncbi:unnamed protein product [Sphagnum tenellum]
MTAAAAEATSPPRCRSSSTTFRLCSWRTNENLLSFEFMLRQYRQLARIRPLVRGDARGEADETDGTGSSGRRHRLDASQLGADGQARPAAVRLWQGCREGERGRPAAKEQLPGAGAAGQVEAVRPADRVRTPCARVSPGGAGEVPAAGPAAGGRAAAAQKIGQDITRYVGQMKAMEEEVAMLRKERAAAGRLVRTTREREDLDESSSRRQQLEARVSGYELQKELEEKCQSVDDAPPPPPQLPPAADNDAAARAVGRLEAALAEARSRCEVGERTLKSLKAKSKILLKQYRQKKLLLEEQDRKMSDVRRSLHAIMAGCADTERNYRSILSHLGSEAEITARLMAAYLGVDVAHAPVRMHGRRLAEWFRDVHALSAWLQRQILAFGSGCGRRGSHRRSDGRARDDRGNHADAPQWSFGDQQRRPCLLLAACGDVRGPGGELGRRVLAAWSRHVFSLQNLSTAQLEDLLKTLEYEEEYRNEVEPPADQYRENAVDPDYYNPYDVVEPEQAAAARGWRRWRPGNPNRCSTEVGIRIRNASCRRH